MVKCIYVAKCVYCIYVYVALYVNYIVILGAERYSYFIYDMLFLCDIAV